MLCGVGGFKIERVDILGILRTISIVIHIGEHTTLKTVVGIVCHRRQNTEIPSGLDFASERVGFLRFGVFLFCVSGNR